MAWHYKYITFSNRRKIAALYRANARPADIAKSQGITARLARRTWKSTGSRATAKMRVGARIQYSGLLYRTAMGTDEERP